MTGLDYCGPGGRLTRSLVKERTVLKRLVLLVSVLCALGLASVALADSVAVSSSIADGQTIKGCVRWDVSVSPGGTEAGVVYYVNGLPWGSGGVLTSSGSVDTYRFGDLAGTGYLDARQLSPGAYLLSAVAVDSSGAELGRSDANVTVASGGKGCATRLK